MIRIAPLGAIPELLREFGVAPEPLLAAHQLAEATLFRDPDTSIPLATVGHLLKCCAEATACPHFGLLVGQRGDPASLGVIGLLLRNAPDVITALNELVTHFDLHDRSATSYLRISDEITYLGYEIYTGGIAGTDQIIDAALAIAMNLMRALCGPGWRASEIRLRREGPLDLESYRNFFQAPLVFNAEQSCLVFPTHWLGQPVQLADPGLRALSLQRVQRMLSHSRQSFTEQVQRTLIVLLGEQHCTREHLSACLSLHPRTLNRRLKEAGTSYRELHARACHVMACQLLRDTRRSVAAIAALLSYSDATAFNRAFSRWEGMSPAKWRKQTEAAETPGTARRQLRPPADFPHR